VIFLNLTAKWKINPFPQYSRYECQGSSFYMMHTSLLME